MENAQSPLHDKTQSFEKLIAWQQAHRFVLDVYKTTKTFPAEERFGLTTQFQRTAVSIAANIAEGYKRKGRTEKLRFYNISQGSLEECRYYIILARDLLYIDEDKANALIYQLESASRMLNNYCHKMVNEELPF